jgi:uncharacterized protein YjbI with pentapeptide repeats
MTGNAGENVDPEVQLKKLWSLQPRSAKFLAACFLAGVTLMPDAALADCTSSAAPGVNWTDCRKRNLMLDGNDLTGSNMTGADLTSTDLRGATLVGSQFMKAGLGRAMLDNSKAEGANFEKAQGFRTSFVKADLKGANFAKSEMQRADFTGAVLTGADFTKSELGRATFTEAELTGTKFGFANLARADFRGAKFEGALDFAQAYLYRTRLEGLDLSKATGLEQWQVDLACGDDKTVLPAGINSHADWPCAEE